MKNAIADDADGAANRKSYYADKSVSEYKKALASLGLLFSYYNDRYHESEFMDPDIRRRVAISIREEKRARRAKNNFLVPKTCDQIESYVKRLLDNGGLKINEKENIKRRIIAKNVEI